MSALLHIMLITLAFLACSQGHPLPELKSDGVRMGRCYPCWGQHPKNQMGCPPCPGDRIPGETRVPGFGQNGNYGSHGDRFRPGRGSYGQGFPGVAIPIN